jgi:hypothetical protein
VIDRLAETERSLALLPPWYTVDRPDDLRMLAGHLRAMRRAGFYHGLPRLERWCRSGQHGAGLT